MLLLVVGVGVKNTVLIIINRIINFLGSILLILFTSHSNNYHSEGLFILFKVCLILLFKMATTTPPWKHYNVFYCIINMK